jgi:single-strand DNA-binding protein
MNHVIIKGNLTRDPETRFTPSGQSITNFTVAVSKQWKNDAGEKMEKTAFIDVKFWGKGGEVVAKHLNKGSPILIHGELDQESWEDKTTNQKRSKIVVNALSFEFCGGDKAGGNQQSQPQQQRQAPQQRQEPQRQASAPVKAANGWDEEDTSSIPF